MTNIVALLQDKATRLKSKTAYYFLTEDDETQLITYSELHIKALAIAVHLQEKHLYTERVLLLYPAGLDFIAALMGCLYAGVIAVPVLAPQANDFKNTSGLINTIAEDADIAYILTTQSYVTTLTSGALTKAYDLFATDALSCDPATLEHYQLPDIQDDTTAYLQYTSGSTSTPKGVITRHGNLTHSLKHTIKAWHYSKNSITLTWAPHSHVYGLVCGLPLSLFIMARRV